MNTLTAVAATVYAIALWMFAPQNRWDKELATAKQNQQNRLNPTPEPVPAPEPEASAQPETTPEPIPEPVPTPEPITAIVEPITEPIPDTQPIKTDTPQTPEPLNLETFTTTQLRELAKKQKLNWRPLVNGKRTPLKKPDLIQLLTA
jgi:outer membrane biosynthesis protein TonB